MLGNLNLSRKQILVLIAVTIALFVVFPLILFIHSRINSATLKVLVAPASSEIYLDGNRVSNGNISVTPGNHTLRAKREGFAEQSIEVDAKKDETTNAFLVLESNDSSTANWYVDHEDDQKIMEEIYSFEYTAGTEDYSKKYPIIDHLPIDTMNYSVDYGKCDNYDFCILVDAPVAAFDTVMTILRRYDESLGNYHFIFSSYTNPFAKFKVSKNSDGASLSDTDLSSAKDYVEKLFSNFSHKTSTVSRVDDYIVASVTYYINDYPDKTTYRLVLQKSGDSWQLLATPSIILEYSAYPDLPGEVLKAANNL